MVLPYISIILMLAYRQCPVMTLQIEGAFVMGLGLCTSEEVLIEPGTGKLLSDSTWTYKIPTAVDIPRQFNVTFLKDSPKIRSASFGIIFHLSM